MLDEKEKFYHPQLVEDEDTPDGFFKVVAVLFLIGFFAVTGLLALVLFIAWILITFEP